MNTARILVFALALIFSYGTAFGAGAATGVSAGVTPGQGTPEAAVPADRFAFSNWWACSGYWQRRIDGAKREIARGPGRYDFVFCGDSITQNWEGWTDETDRENLRRHIASGRITEELAHIRPMQAWLDLQKRCSALNLGISGDSTQHLLWRLTRGGLLKGYTARYFCLLIGGNNKCSPEEVLAGVRANVEAIRAAHPESVILLHALFPCKAGTHHRRNCAANELMRRLADGRRVIWVDLNPKLSAPDGSANPDLFPDMLHPNERGYRIWAAALADFTKAVPSGAP